ncbi:hypothetical protein PILCRDRAFT_36337, partial [Piloderma croceum F 1598]
LKKAIHLVTVQRWMKEMGYWWTKKPSGQYVDSHKKDDVVFYHQTAELDKWTRLWTSDNQEIINEALTNGQTIVVWFHNKSTFYAND